MVMRPPGLIALVGGVTLAFAICAEARAASSRTDQSCAAHLSEAARRSALPTEVLFRVMRAESGGNPRAVSPRGAMGCMQIMPATWRDLTARHGLGNDPFHPRMNMIGGALYLAELARRFGFPGAFAAYNAGPARYQRWREGVAKLPSETLAYAKRIGNQPAFAGPAIHEPRWQESTLFASQADGIAEAATSRRRLDAGAETHSSLFPLSGNASATSAGR
jgi:soluble lytic murein transglycosylase-like protein